MLLQIALKDVLPYLLAPGGVIIVLVVAFLSRRKDKAVAKKTEMETEISLYREAMNYADNLKLRCQEAERQVDMLKEELDNERDVYEQKIEHERREYDKRVRDLERRMNDERDRCREIQNGLEGKIRELQREINRLEQLRQGPAR